MTSKEFWDYTLDDHANIDLPTMVDYVLKVSQQSQLHYIGHSQGTVMAFAGLSQNVELQSKIKVFRGTIRGIIIFSVREILYSHEIGFS